LSINFREELVMKCVQVLLGLVLLGLFQGCGIGDKIDSSVSSLYAPKNGDDLFTRCVNVSEGSTIYNACGGKGGSPSGSTYPLQNLATTFALIGNFEPITYFNQGATVQVTAKFAAPSSPSRLDVRIFKNGVLTDSCNTTSLSSAGSGKYQGSCSFTLGGQAALGPRSFQVDTTVGSNHYVASSEDGFSVGFNPANCGSSDQIHCLYTLNTAEIQSAINSASPGDTIWLSLGNWQNFSNSELVVHKTLNLTGAVYQSTIHRSSEGRAIRVTAPNVLIQGVGFNGYGPGPIPTPVAEGGIMHADSAATSLVVDHVNMFGGRSMNGGALALIGASNAQIIDSEFSSNLAYDFGGAISIYVADNVVIRRSNFNQNVSNYGGALSVLSSSNTKISGGNWLYNKSYFYGGAISFFDGTGTFVVDRATFDSNGAAYGGGSVHMYAPNTLTTIQYSKFFDNVSQNGAKAISVAGNTFMQPIYILHNNFVESPYIDYVRQYHGLTYLSFSMTRFDGNSGSPGLMYDNIFHGTGGAANCSGIGGYPAIGYNDFSGMSPGNCALESTNIFLDPLFLNYEMVVLKPNSPALGTASDGTNIGIWQGN
jgi:hypothetical protein